MQLILHFKAIIVYAFKNFPQAYSLTYMYTQHN